MSNRRPTGERVCTDCGQSFLGVAVARWCPDCRWRHRGKPAIYAWTPERDQILRERYDSRIRGRLDELVRLTGWPKWCLSRRAGHLGLAAPRAPHRDWTPEEERFLLDKAGRRTLPWMARQLGRTEASVALKLKRLHLSRRFREGYTLRELELCFGVDHRVIQRWVAEGKLEAERRGALRGDTSRDAWCVTDVAILAFLTQHPMAFELRRVEQFWFMDLITSGGLVKRALRDERALEEARA